MAREYPTLLQLYHEAAVSSIEYLLEGELHHFWKKFVLEITSEAYWERLLLLSKKTLSSNKRQHQPRSGKRKGKISRST